MANQISVYCFSRLLFLRLKICGRRNRYICVHFLVTIINITLKNDFITLLQSELFVNPVKTFMRYISKHAITNFDLVSYLLPTYKQLKLIKGLVHTVNQIKDCSWPIFNAYFAF